MALDCPTLTGDTDLVVADDHAPDEGIAERMAEEQIPPAAVAVYSVMTGVPTAHRYREGVMHGFFGPAAIVDKADQAQQEAARRFAGAFGATVPSVL